MSKTYKLIKGSAAEAFHLSRAKIRLYGGGFANGKTTALVIDALKVAKDYPGCTMMLGRASYPKLNSTLRREFFKWCPASWIKSSNMKDNTCVLINGTTIDFRYIDQRTTAQGESTSNLLSANYDYIGVDQIEDPEITEHDFEQLLGRLRGSAEYKGNDPTMPRTGPRMMALTCNPTLGWVYKRLVKPLHDLRNGFYNAELICEVDSKGQRVLVDGMPKPIIEVFEASTYENAQNLEADYIKTLEATYRGKMRDRYLHGKWVAFEGVVYDEFDETMHIVSRGMLDNHLNSLREEGQQFTVLEAYDFGSTAPSCYLLAVVDADGIIYIIDGFYEPSAIGGIAHQVDMINKLRKQHVYAELSASELEPEILADPSMFRTSNAGMLQGASTVQMFADKGIVMRRGNNARLNGILKVKQYLNVQETLINPFTSAYGCPKLFIAEHLTWFRDEITTWRWARDRNDEAIDKPIDGHDHAMDALRYLITDTPSNARIVSRKRKPLPAKLRMWHEFDAAQRNDNRSHRYAL